MELRFLKMYQGWSILGSVMGINTVSGEKPVFFTVSEISATPYCAFSKVGRIAKSHSRTKFGQKPAVSKTLFRYCLKQYSRGIKMRRSLDNSFKQILLRLAKGWEG